MKKGQDVIEMKALLTLLFGTLILSGCNTASHRSAGQRDRVFEAKHYGMEAFDMPEPMDGVFSSGTFHSLTLPRVDGLLFVRDINCIDIAINRTGDISIARSPMSVHELSDILRKAVAYGATNQAAVAVVIGADENTPFDRVWPVLLACCSNGVWKLGLAVSAGEQEYMNILRIFLPMTGSNTPYRSPVILKQDTAFTIIGVQTNGLLLARQKGGLVTERKWLGKEPFPGCIHEAEIPPLGDIGKESTTVVIVPAKGATYGQVARTVYWCRRFGQNKVSLIREDVLPVFNNKKE